MKLNNIQSILSAFSARRFDFIIKGKELLTLFLFTESCFILLLDSIFRNLFWVFLIIFSFICLYFFFMLFVIFFAVLSETNLANAVLSIKIANRLCFATA